ncbi:MAG: T6SS immunity protein Tli4 family protein [Telluria sp.]
MRRSLILVLVLAVLACAGSWAASQVRSMRDRSEVAKMTERMKTVCIGRFLVDVPAQAQVSLSGGMLGGFEIRSRQERRAEFEKRLKEREAELGASDEHAEMRRVDGLIESRALHIPKMIGSAFVYGRTRSGGVKGERPESEYVSVETHAHVDGISLVLAMQYADETDIKLSEALLARLQVRAEADIPAAAGFCIWRAMFVEPLPTHHNEQIVMHLGLPSHPDVDVALFSIAGAKAGPGILSRSADVDASTSAAELLRVTKRRAGKRSINGLMGEEILERVREHNFATTYGFNWETRGIAEDFLQPYLALELQSGINARPGGEPVSTSLHEDALLQLWDTIASSIRLRTPDTLRPHPAQPATPAQATRQAAAH